VGEILAYIGFPEIRAYDRITVYIGFVSLCAAAWAVGRALPRPARCIRGHVQPDHPLDDRHPADGRLALGGDASTDLDANEVEVRPGRVHPGRTPAAVRGIPNGQAATLERAVR
jgi:hypothetical protein